MRIEDVVLAIQNGTIQMQDIAEAKAMIENEIENCIVVVQDVETELYSRLEFQGKLSLYKKLLNRL